MQAKLYRIHIKNKMIMKKNIVFTFMLCSLIRRTELGTSFQWQEPERMEETERQS